MAAAADIDIHNNTLPIDTIAGLVRNVCSKYTWNKRDSTYATFQKRLKNLAEDIDISLENLATSSCTHVINYVYPSIVPKFDWQKVPELNERFQNIPYIIYVGEDNITTVVFRSGNVDCPLKEITPDMMHMLRYLGIVRVYVIGNLNIPCWPDNIVHLEINNVRVMRHLDTNRIPFPKYLQKLMDLSKFEGSYTNWLPPTLTTLVSACSEMRNISPNLKIYTYIGEYPDDRLLANAEYLPIGLDKVIYTNTFDKLDASEISMPPGTQYLDLKLDRIHSRVLMFKNVRTLLISKFKVFVKVRHQENVASSNLTLAVDSHCCEGCNLYEQNVDVIFEEGLEHLMVYIQTDCLGFIDASIELLKCISQVPTSLKKLSVLVCINNNKVFSKSIQHIHPKTIILSESTTHIQDFLRPLAQLNNEYDEILQDFIRRFPHIEVSIGLK